MSNADDLAVTTAVPVIDVSSLGSGRIDAEREATRQIGVACRDWGFLQVCEHGIPESLLAEVEAQIQAFFALPIHAKRDVQRDADNAWGYYDRELTKNTRDWKEIFDFGHDPARDATTAGPDGRSRWPDGLPGFRDALLRYFAACESLAFRLLRAVCASLSVAPDALDASFRPAHSSFVRLNHYPPCPTPADATHALRPAIGHLGVNHHTDAGALTLLAQSDVASLQVHRGDRWHSVVPRRGALVINVGDLMQVWSNDRYRAPLHRVLAQRERARWSAPFFFNPRYDAKVAPLSALVGPNHPARYRPVPWEEFRSLRAAGDYTDAGDEVQISDYAVA